MLQGSECIIGLTARLTAARLLPLSRGGVEHTLMDDEIMNSRIVVQEGGTEVRLPYAGNLPAGYRITVEHKRSGQVVRTEDYVNVVLRFDDGEAYKQWKRVAE